MEIVNIQYLLALSLTPPPLFRIYIRVRKRERNEKKQHTINN